MKSPLADRLRPTCLLEVFGQKHLLAQGRILPLLEKSGEIPSLIFFGPPGTGKTTVANILAKASNKMFYKLNATTAALSDIKELPKGNTLLYLDEIQNFNKRQQQHLLSYMEDGSVTLIASTTENPYFYVYGALLSRATVFEFKPLSEDDLRMALNAAVGKLKSEGVNVTLDEDAAAHIAACAHGDARSAVNCLELVVMASPMNAEGIIAIDLKTVEEATTKKAYSHDKDGDSHYDCMSAFQKSMRGSDPDAAIHYLARLIEGGDIASACRRLMVTAAEDIGLAYPQAVSIVKSCVDCAQMLGMPEAAVPLAQAVVLLATAPKSNASYVAVHQALDDLRTKDTGQIPPHIRDSSYGGAKKLGRGLTYQYPHSFPNHYVKQRYLPDKIKDVKYYIPGDNKAEQLAKAYWDQHKQ